MKLIKKGKKPMDKTCDWQCKRCKSIFQAKASEGRFVSDQRDGDAVVFVCPECNTDNWVAVSLFR